MQWLDDREFARRDAIAALARAAADEHPDDPARWTALARALRGVGAYREAIERLELAVARFPASADLHMLLALNHGEEADLEAALAHTERALAIDPARHSARRQRYHLLARLNRIDASTPADVAEVPFLAESSALLVRRTRDVAPAQALADCEAVLAAKPTHCTARCRKAVALARLGRAAEACAILDSERDLWIGEIDAPPIYPTGAAFRDELARAVLREPTLALDPPGRSGRNLYSTRSLRRSAEPSIVALMELLRAAVDACEGGLNEGGALFAARPHRADLSIWASVNRGDGWQRSHHHPDGWLSGVYYVTAPRPHGANAYAGPLLLGATSREDDLPEPPWGVREIEPVPGRLVLFPSYFPHATAPTNRDECRISIAFDVVAG